METKEAGRSTGRTGGGSSFDGGSNPSQLLFVSFHSVRNGNRYSTYLCKCGTEKVIRNSLVKTRLIVSCGCYRRSVAGKSNNPIYKIWKEMLRRCADLENKNYGMRGISVCDRWKNSFDDFKNDMGERPKGFSVERLNVNGDYSPDNCVWANSYTQRHNQRRSHGYESTPCPF